MVTIISESDHDTIMVIVRFIAGDKRQKTLRMMTTLDDLQTEAKAGMETTRGICPECGEPTFLTRPHGEMPNEDMEECDEGT